MVDGEGVLTFRLVEEADLPLLHRWLNEPGVVRWWEGDDVSWEGVVEDYAPPASGPGRHEDDGTTHHLGLLDGEPVGWIQTDELLDDDAQAWWAAGLLQGTTVGIDFLVGEPARRGAGLGSRMIGAYVRDVVLVTHPGATHVAADPQVANEASWRALARAGFVHLADHDGEHGPCRLMALGVSDRRDLSPGSASAAS